MANKSVKQVLPTLREKKRYLAFEIISDGRIDNVKTVSDAIMAAVYGFIGSLGAGKAGILVLEDKWNSRAQKGIIRVGHKHVDQLKGSLTMIEKINNVKVIIRSIGLSGVLNKVNKLVL